MVQLDGSKYEGGGAVLRTATALSAVTQQPLRLINIRKERKNPGLRPQHLSSLRAASELCNAKVEGDRLDSEQIEFEPGQIRSKPLSVNIKTAGSITLALQGLIPIAIQASEPVEIHFKGGATDTFFSPTWDYFQHVFLKNLERMGGSVELNINQRGYYPEGGAHLKVKIKPADLRSLHLTNRKRVEQIRIKSGASTKLEDDNVAERQASSAGRLLPEQLPLKKEIDYYQTECPGSQICLIADFGNATMGTDSLGKMGKKAEQVGKEAAQELLEEQKSKACLDKHMGDQILIYLALAKQESKVTVSEITDHCKTNMWIIEKFLEGSFKTEKNSIKWKSG